MQLWLKMNWENKELPLFGTVCLNKKAKWFTLKLNYHGNHSNIDPCSLALIFHSIASFSAFSRLYINVCVCAFSQHFCQAHTERRKEGERDRESRLRHTHISSQWAYHVHTTDILLKTFIYNIISHWWKKNTLFLFLIFVCGFFFVSFQGFKCVIIIATFACKSTSAFVRVNSPFQIKWISPKYVNWTTLNSWTKSISESLFLEQ